MQRLEELTQRAVEVQSAIKMLQEYLEQLEVDCMFEACYGNIDDLEYHEDPLDDPNMYLA